jgi:transcription initiation factor TFIIIB Brf1 subunit/transcription initiation factor TFIIB
MNCDHENIDINDGERVCTGCGTILGSVIDEGAEWRVYSNTEDDPARTGTITNELLPDSSYGSMMKRRRGGQRSEEAKTIAKLSAWSFSSHGERSWMGMFDAIQSSCLRACLPKAIVLDACAMFKKVEDAQKTRGETRRALMAASVFVACRQHNATRTHEEIAELFRVSIRAICKALARFEAGVPSATSNVLNTQLGIAERICADMSISDSDREKVMNMIGSLPEMEHTPKTIVAGVLCFILGNQVQAICEASKVSTVSIRKIVEKLKTIAQAQG